MKADNIAENTISLYVMINEMMIRGFRTTEYQKELQGWKNLLFKNERGYVVIPELETRTLFEIGDCVLIKINKTT